MVHMRRDWKCFKACTSNGVNWRFSYLSSTYLYFVEMHGFVYPVIDYHYTWKLRHNWRTTKTRHSPGQSIREGDFPRWCPWNRFFLLWMSLICKSFINKVSQTNGLNSHSRCLYDDKSWAWDQGVYIHQRSTAERKNGGDWSCIIFRVNSFESECTHISFPKVAGFVG